MQVPVRRTPGTNVSSQQLGYQRATPGFDFEAIERPLKDLAAQLEGDKKNRQAFELQRRLVDETNALNTDFEERKTKQPLGAQGFTDRVLTDYTERHKVMMEEYWQQGFDRDTLEQFDTRLATLRGSFGQQALAYQTQSTSALADSEMDKFTVGLSQYAATNPKDGYASALEEAREGWNNFPGISAEQREKGFERSRAAIKAGAAKAIALQDPDFVLKSLDPNGVFAPALTQPGAPAGAKAASYTGFQSVAGTVAQQLGLDPVDVAAVMSFETSGTFDPNIKGGDGGNYLGLIQFGQEEQRKYGIRKGSSPEQWSQAIVSFMNDRGFKPGMGIEDFYSTILTGGPGRYDATDSNGTNVRNAIPRIMAQHRGKAEAWLQRGAMPIINANELGGMDVPKALETFDPGAGTSPEQPALAPNKAPEFDLATAKTGHPLLDDLDGAERLQVLGWASAELEKKRISQTAAMDVTVDNILSEALSNEGQVATAIPSAEELMRLYGPVKGPQIHAQIQQAKATGLAIGQFTTLSPATMQQRVEGLRPTPGSPTFAVEQKMFDAAQAAAQRVLDEREADPAAAAMKYYPSLQRAAKQGTPQYFAELDRILESWGMDRNDVNPLSKDATSKLTEDYKYLDPASKIDWMQKNFQAMGEDRFQRFVDRMVGTPAAREARMYALMRETSSLATLRTVFEGAEIIRKDPARKPNFNMLLTEFRKNAAQAIGRMDANMSAAVQDAAAAYYAYRGGDPSVIDADLYKESLKVALGGREIADMTNRTWGRETVKDHTILPPGVSETKFTNWLETRQPGDLTRMSLRKRPPVYADLKTPVALDEIVDYGVFVMIAPDHYVIKMANDDNGGILRTDNGKPFVVQLGRKDIK